MFFKKRKKATVELYCKTQYLQILAMPDPDGPASAAEWQNKALGISKRRFDELIAAIMKSSPAFSSKEEQLRAEMTFLRFALFSLAFYHRTSFSLSAV